MAMLGRNLQLVLVSLVQSADFAQSRAIRVGRPQYRKKKVRDKIYSSFL